MEEAGLPDETPLSPLPSFESAPTPQDQSRLLELLGLINYKILSGNILYIETGGIVYKIRYGVYWRSVFTDVEHYSLKCEEITEGIWVEGSASLCEVDLPLRHTRDGWKVGGQSIRFMMHRC